MPRAPEHLRGGGVVAGVLGQAERGVGGVGVEALVLEGVRVELVVEADAAALLAEVEQDAAAVCDPLHRLAQLRAAVAPGRAEDVAGQALGVQPDERVVPGAGVAQHDGHVFLAVGEAVEGDQFGVHGLAVAEAQRYPDAGARGGGGEVGHAVSPGPRAVSVLQI